MGDNRGAKENIAQPLPLFKRDLRGMFSRVSNILVEELL